jgi:hypothetical protein
MNRILAEIVDSFDGESKVRLREMDGSGCEGLYLEIPGDEDELTEPALAGVTPDQLRDFCEQVSRALDPQATGSHSRSVRVALEAKP